MHMLEICLIAVKLDFLQHVNKVYVTISVLYINTIWNLFLSHCSLL